MVSSSGLRHLPFHPKQSSDWGACQNKHVRQVTPGPNPGICDCGSQYQPLYIEQRRLVWADESSIVSSALLPNGRADSTEMLRLMLERTCRNANFPTDPDQIEDPDLGWYLYEWLGCKALIDRLTGTGERRKNSSNGSAQRSPEPPQTPRQESAPSASPPS